MTHAREKMLALLEEEGYADVKEFIKDTLFESIVPGICMNDGCNATYHYEPDQDRGWCENCETNSVKSAHILFGLI